MGFLCREMSYDSSKQARHSTDHCNHGGHSILLCELSFSIVEPRPNSQRNQNYLAEEGNQYEWRIWLSFLPFRYHFPDCIDTKMPAFGGFLPSNLSKTSNENAVSEYLYRTQGSSPRAERLRLFALSCTDCNTLYDDLLCNPRRTGHKSNLGSRCIPLCVVGLKQVGNLDHAFALTNNCLEMPGRYVSRAVGVVLHARLADIAGAANPFANSGPLGSGECVYVFA